MTSLLSDTKIAHKKDTRTEDWVANLAGALGVAFFVSFLFPYKEIWRRIKIRDLKIYELIFVEFIAALIFVFLLDPHIRSWYAAWTFPKKYWFLGILNVRQWIYLYGIFHLFYAILGGTSKRMKEKIDKQIQTVDFVTKKKPLSYLYHIDLGGGRKKYVFDNSSHTLKEILDHKETVGNALRTHVIRVTYGDEEGASRIVIYTNDKKDGEKTYLLEELLKKVKLAPEEFIIGVSEETGDIQKITLKKMIHMLIGGETGSGKTAFQTQLLATLILYNRDLMLNLMDFKGGVGFQAFEGIPNVKVIDNAKDGAYTLLSLAEDLERREALLRKSGVDDIRKLKDPLPRILTVIDEAYELFSDRSRTKGVIAQARDSISLLTSKGRAFGIHLIIATQYPTKADLPTVTKNNLTTKIAFKVGTDAGSTAIIGSNHAKDLPDRAGAGIWKKDFKRIYFQAPYISPEDCKQLLKDLYDPTYTRKTYLDEKEEQARILESNTIKDPLSSDEG